MSRSAAVRVQVDLERVRQNVRDIAALTGVPIIAVVKADAYGLGAQAVTDAVAPLVAGFYVFSAQEAIDVDLRRFPGKPTIALLGAVENVSAPWIVPVIWSRDQAAALHGRAAVVAVDTGQQRFACPLDQLAALMDGGHFSEVMTHASTPEQAKRFDEAVAPWAARPGFCKHAAGSSLLSVSAARFDAVRPGMAMYQDAVTVRTTLVDARPSTGPAGYTGFRSPHFGVVLAGYSNGLRVGPCRVNGAERRILEVGMQSAFVEIGPGDRVGDEVVLLDAQLTPRRVARSWGTTPQAVLVSLAGSGVRQYV